MLLLRRRTGTAQGPWGWPPKISRPTEDPLTSVALEAPLLAFLVSGKARSYAVHSFQVAGERGAATAAAVSEPPHAAANPEPSPRSQPGRYSIFSFLKVNSSSIYAGDSAYWRTLAPSARCLYTRQAAEPFRASASFPHKIYCNKTTAAKWPNEEPGGAPKPQGAPQRAPLSPAAQPRLCRIASCQRTRNPVGLPAF